jgi:hypothetical protein
MLRGRLVQLKRRDSLTIPPRCLGKSSVVRAATLFGGSQAEREFSIITTTYERKKSFDEVIIDIQAGLATQIEMLLWVEGKIFSGCQ